MYITLQFHTHRQMMLCVAAFVVAMQVFIAQAMLGHPDLGDLGTVIFIATFGWLLIGTFATNLLIRRGVQSFAGVPIAAPRSAAWQKVGRPISVPNYTQNSKDC